TEPAKGLARRGGKPGTSRRWRSWNVAASLKAKRVWKTLMGYYGSRLADSYGPQPPDEWCEVIDRCDNERLARALSQIRREHVTFPPTLGQFEAATKRPLKSGRERTVAEKLTQFVVENRGLTPTQLRGPWKWLADSEGV